MLSLIAQFTYLQLLDLLTTLVFLLGGLREANPAVNLLIQTTGTPLAGLLAVKAAGLGLGFYCWRGGRQKLLARANIFYALLVAWNLVAIVVNAAGKAPV